MVILIIVIDDSKLYSWSLCSFPFPDTSYLLVPHTFLSLLFSNTRNLYSDLRKDIRFQTHRKQQVKKYILFHFRVRKSGKIILEQIPALSSLPACYTCCLLVACIWELLAQSLQIRLFTWVCFTKSPRLAFRLSTCLQLQQNYDNGVHICALRLIRIV
jgi:hypothetical protein